VKDAKLTPRITGTAKVLWLIYVALTVVCALSYWGAGMPLFEAIGHSMSTVSTGGFSNHDASLAYFDNPVIETIAVLFMFLGGVNFALHYMVWRHRSVAEYLRDSEFKVFLAIIGGAIALYSVALWWGGSKPDLASALRAASFQVVSIQMPSYRSNSATGRWSRVWSTRSGDSLRCS
jgi:trk system potassium uptake protein TrkH